MAINLKKGQKIDLTKGRSGLEKILVGLGWDEAVNGKISVDCDASVILLNEQGKLVNKKVVNETIIYFNNLIHSSGAIVHQGDNLTGGGEGDCEQIKVNLSLVPGNIGRILFVVNIYDANKKRQHFGMIKNAYIRLVNENDNSEICRYILSDNYNNMTGLIVGEIYRKDNEWKFNAIGQPVENASRLDNIAKMYV